jgi:hypothetical protein
MFKGMDLRGNGNDETIRQLEYLKIRQLEI